MRRDISENNFIYKTVEIKQFIHTPFLQFSFAILNLVNANLLIL